MSDYECLIRLRYYSQQSPRKGEIYVPIDLGSIPETLFESELFGFEKGAFTDARKKKPGRLEVASGGTLFLNEIGNLSLPLQAKLLSVIEQRKSSRLGSTTSYPVDVRLICATNADLYTGRHSLRISVSRLPDKKWWNPVANFCVVR